MRMSKEYRKGSLRHRLRAVLFSYPEIREEQPLIQFFVTILDEMGRGNFSFLILIVGILQLIAMLKKNKDK